MIIPETNASGIAILQGILDLNVYRAHPLDERDLEQGEKLGWKTSTQSKQLLISHFQELLKDEFVEIFDEDTVSEMKTFIWSDIAQEKYASAEKGFKDDNLIATMLSLWPVTTKHKLVRNILKEDYMKALLAAKRKNRIAKSFQYR